MDRAAPPRVRALVRQAGQPEIHELDLIGDFALRVRDGQEKNVLRLDVVVKHAPNVDVVKSSAKLGDKAGKIGTQLRGGEEGQVLSVQVFQGQERLAVLPQNSEIMDRRQIRVTEPGHGPEFLFEAVHSGIREKAVAQSLQGHGLLAAEEIRHQEDLAHPPFSQWAENTVTLIEDRSNLGQVSHSYRFTLWWLTAEVYAEWERRSRQM